MGGDGSGRKKKPALRRPEERDALAAAHVRLTLKAAGRFWSYLRPWLRARMEVEELRSAAWLGLLRAAELWEEGRGYRFSTYAWPWMWLHMQTWAGREPGVGSRGKKAGKSRHLALLGAE